MRAGIRVDFFYVLIGRSASAVASTLVAILVTNRSTADVSAKYFLAFSLVSVLTIIAQFGVASSVARIVGTFVAQGHNLLAAKVSFVSILFVFLCSCIVSGFYLIIHKPLSMLVNLDIGGVSSALALLIWMALNSIQLLVAELFRARFLVNYATFFGGCLSNYLSLAMLAMFSRFASVGLSIEDVFFSLVVGNAMSLIVSSWLLCRLKIVMPATKKECVRLGKMLFSSGRHNVITILSAFVVTQSGIWWVGRYGSAADVADFGVASRLVLLLSMVSAMIAAVYTPRVASLFGKRDVGGAQRMASQIAGLMLTVCGLLAAFVMAFAEPVVCLVFGRERVGAVLWVYIVGTGFLVNSFSGMRGQLLMLAGFEQIQARIAIGGAIAVLLGAFLAGANYGPVHAVMVSTAIFVLVGFVELIALKRHAAVLSLPEFFLKRKRKS